MAGFYLEPLLSKTNLLTAEPQGIAGQLESLSEYITWISLSGFYPVHNNVLKRHNMWVKERVNGFHGSVNCFRANYITGGLELISSFWVENWWEYIRYTENHVGRLDSTLLCCYVSAWSVKIWADHESSLLSTRTVLVQRFIKICKQTESGFPCTV